MILSDNAIYVKDLNGDNLSDIILLSKENDSVTVLLNQDNNLFEDALHFNTETSPTSLTIGDFNNNGTSDILVINSGDSKASLILDLNSKVQSVDLDPDSSPTSITSLDFNNDGNLDLAVTSNNNVTLFTGNGNGSFVNKEIIGRLSKKAPKRRPVWLKMIFGSERISFK